VTIRVVEVNAPAAIEMIDFAGPLTHKIRVKYDTFVTQAGECGFEFLLAYQEGAVMRLDLAASTKSIVTPLLVRSGTNGPHWGPTSSPRIVARKFAEVHFSFAGTMMWLSCTLIFRSFCQA
jgi:hypothetical protein